MAGQDCKKSISIENDINKKAAGFVAAFFIIQNSIIV